MVKRYVSVRARALGLDGKVIRINAEELLAQALEHEIDHLNGILYIGHLVSADSLWKIPPASEGAEGDEDEDSDEEEEQEDDPEASASFAAQEHGSGAA